MGAILNSLKLVGGRGRETVTGRTVGALGRPRSRSKLPIIECDRAERAGVSNSFLAVAHDTKPKARRNTCKVRGGTSILVQMPALQQQTDGQAESRPFFSRRENIRSNRSGRT